MTAEIGSTPCYTLPDELEQQRVRAVEQLNLLDSPGEDRFARITRMARTALQVPMAAVSLIDRDRQWFKQVDGLEMASSIPRVQTVCQATVVRGYERPTDPALILEDAVRSEFANIPGIGGDGGIRFYAGYPLHGPGGHVVGTFCVYDVVPRSLTDPQLDTFKELALWAQHEIEHSDDLERAALVQRRLLPAPLGDLRGYRLRGMCLPAHAVGGDFYDHYRVRGGITLTVADVMGKGLAAAMLTAMVRSALRVASQVLEGSTGEPDPAEAVGSVAAQLEEDLESTETFVTVFHGHLDLDTGTLRFTDAGHGFAALVRGEGDAQPLAGRGLPLGVFRGDMWESQTVTLAPGDTVVVSSDGILDLFEDVGGDQSHDQSGDHDGDLGDADGVGFALDFFRRHPDPDELCARTRALAAAHPTLDDITVVALRRDPPS